jgi:hypothetical protein
MTLILVDGGWRNRTPIGRRQAPATSRIQAAARRQSASPPRPRSGARIASSPGRLSKGTRAVGRCGKAARRGGAREGRRPSPGQRPIGVPSAVSIKIAGGVPSRGRCPLSSHRPPTPGLQRGAASGMNLAAADPAGSSRPQECSSMARAPVSKTGGWGFESLHSCQRSANLSVSVCRPRIAGRR